MQFTVMFGCMAYKCVTQRTALKPFLRFSSVSPTLYTTNNGADKGGGSQKPPANEMHKCTKDNKKNFACGINAEYMEYLFTKWVRDHKSVHESWHEYFSELLLGEKHVIKSSKANANTELKPQGIEAKPNNVNSNVKSIESMSNNENSNVKGIEHKPSESIETKPNNADSNVKGIKPKAPIEKTIESIKPVAPIEKTIESIRPVNKFVGLSSKRKMSSESPQSDVTSYLKKAKDKLLNPNSNKSSSTKINTMTGMEHMRKLQQEMRVVREKDIDGIADTVQVDNKNKIAQDQNTEKLKELVLNNDKELSAMPKIIKEETHPNSQESAQLQAGSDILNPPDNEQVSLGTIILTPVSNEVTKRMPGQPPSVTELIGKLADDEAKLMKDNNKSSNAKLSYEQRIKKAFKFNLLSKDLKKEITAALERIEKQKLAKNKK